MSAIAPSLHGSDVAKVAQIFQTINEECMESPNSPECTCSRVLQIIDRTIRELINPGEPSKMAVPTFFSGQEMVLFVDVDNTSRFGGGPFRAQQARIELTLPAEATLIYPAGEFADGRWRIGLGSLAAGATMPVPVVVRFNVPGVYDFAAEVSTELFDPNPANNRLPMTVQVLEARKQLLFPWVSHNDQFASTFVINNYGPEKAILSVEAIRGEGLGRRSQMVVPARGFLNINPGDTFPGLGKGSGLLVSVLANHEAISGVWVTRDLTGVSGDSPSQGVAVALNGEELKTGSAVAKTSRDLLFNYLPAGGVAVSAPVLVNVGDEPASVSLEFFNQNGVLLHRETDLLRALAPMRPFAAVTQTLLPGSQEDVYLRARSDQPLTGVGFVFNQFGEPSIGNAGNVPAADGEPAHWLLPWVSNSSGFESLVLISNPGEAAAQVRLTARRRSGAAEAVLRTIPARGFLRANAGQLFPQMGEGAGYAVEIESNRPGLSANWVTNNLVTPSGSSPSQGSGINLVSGANGGANASIGQDLIFGFLPLTDGLISGPVLVNVGAGEASVTLRFFDEMGNLLAEDRTSLQALPPMRPFAAVANDLVPSAGKDIYLVASSDGQPLAGVGFAFNSVGEPAIGNARAIAFQPSP